MNIQLKYGCNPNQNFAQITSDVNPYPLEVINGTPSMINALDALRSWQLVRELSSTLSKPAAGSFKHVSPAGAAVAGQLSEDFLKAHFYDFKPDELSPVAGAYARARSSDRVASFGDFVAVSEKVDISLAKLLKTEVSDGIIAPEYDPQALEILAGKKGGKYVMFKIDKNYLPDAETEYRSEFGLRIEQSVNTAKIDRQLLDNVVTKNTTLPDSAVETLLVATVTLKHTLSNSMALGYAGQAVGIGAGQQSRIACTRLACDKADRWFLKLHPKTLNLQFKDGVVKPNKVNAADAFTRWHLLDDSEKQVTLNLLEKAPDPISSTERQQWLKQFENVALSSDAFLPFRDNIDRAARSGAQYVVQAGGSRRDEDVIHAANEHNMVMAMSGLRLFLH